MPRIEEAKAAYLAFQRERTKDKRLAEAAGLISNILITKAGEGHKEFTIDMTTYLISSYRDAATFAQLSEKVKAMGFTSRSTSQLHCYVYSGWVSKS